MAYIVPEKNKTQPVNLSIPWAFPFLCRAELFEQHLVADPAEALVAPGTLHFLLVKLIG